MTKLAYMEGFDIVSCDAQVLKTEKHEDKKVIILDQTCFYAKAGGQDFDQGTITSNEASFRVDAVFFVDGEVKHIGEYTKGELSVGDTVACQVDEERRSLNTRLHSGGHVIDMAVRSLGLGWKPDKGAHYPDMAFVEYQGEFNPEQKEDVIAKLQQKVDELISKGTVNTIEFMTPEEMATRGAFVPENLPKEKPSRAVIYDDFIVPCGGTHVRDIREVGKVKIKKIKRKDGNIRVSYEVENKVEL